MPNLVFRDGFDTYNGISSAATGFPSKWTGAMQSFVTGRFGVGQAARASSGFTHAPASPPFAAQSSFTVECGIKFVNDGTGQMLQLRNGNTVHLNLKINANGSIDVQRNGTTLGSTAAAAFVFDTWYSFQWEVVISDTVGRATIYLDGVQKVNLTNQDTANGSPASVDNIRIASGSNNASIEVDDLIITDSATRLSNPIRASTLYPTSDGGTLNLVPSTGTSHFALVDEALASATDYLSGSTVGDLDLLGLGNLAASPLAIQEVNVIGYASKTDATNRSIALGVKSGATTSDGSNFALSSSGGRFERPLAVDPNTGSAWTEAAVNALELQPKVTV
jgi:hypothetical protein